MLIRNTLKNTLTLIFSVLSLTTGIIPECVLAQWVATSGPNANTVTCLVVNGENLFAGTKTDGIFRSDGNGQNWEEIDTGLATRRITAITKIGQTLLAGTVDKGIFISSDNGRNWKIIEDKVLDTLFIQSFTVIGSSIYTLSSKGIFFSADTGVTWRNLDGSLPTNAGITALGVCGGNILAAMSNYSNLNNSDIIFLSSNNGAQWQDVHSGHGSHVSVFASKDNNIVAGFDNGAVIISSDYGKTWGASPGISHGVLAVLTIGNNLYIGLYGGGVYQSTDIGKSWYSVKSGLYDKDLNVYSLANSDSTLFAGTELSVFRRPLSEMIGSNAANFNQRLESTPISFPNPFSMKTSISFSNDQREFVSVKIVDVLGNQWANLFAGQLDAGNHSYEWNALTMPQGTYFCIIRANGVSTQLPVMLIK